jgi:hypothetical protein
VPRAGAAPASLAAPWQPPAAALTPGELSSELSRAWSAAAAADAAASRERAAAASTRAALEATATLAVGLVRLLDPVCAPQAGALLAEADALARGAPELAARVLTAIATAMGAQALRRPGDAQAPSAAAAAAAVAEDRAADVVARRAALAAAVDAACAREMLRDSAALTPGPSVQTRQSASASPPPVPDAPASAALGRLPPATPGLAPTFPSAPATAAATAVSLRAPAMDFSDAAFARLLRRVDEAAREAERGVSALPPRSPPL